MVEIRGIYMHGSYELKKKKKNNNNNNNKELASYHAQISFDIEEDLILP